MDFKFQVHKAIFSLLQVTIRLSEVLGISPKQHLDVC